VNSNKHRKENLVKNLTSDTIDKVNGAAQSFQSKIQSTEKNLEKIVHNAGETVGAVAADLANSASDLAKSATDYAQTGREYVRENPLKGVALAAAAGIVAGGLLTLALRRR
jgi:ElaB/YqjD/DUF883 family membrane-anchored ribosome-binding protein